MSEQEERSVEGVLQEMQRVGEAVDIARRVVLVGTERRSALAAELGNKLACLGLKIELVEPEAVEPARQEEGAAGLYNSFADVLACQSLAHLFGGEDLAPCGIPPDRDPDSMPALLPEPESVMLLDPELPADLEPTTVPERPPERPDVLMGCPETWQEGDLFEDHPRYTLPHKIRKWVLESFDADSVTLRGPNCNWSDLISLGAFQKRYVFHARPQSAAE